MFSQCSLGRSWVNAYFSRGRKSGAMRLNVHGNSTLWFSTLFGVFQNVCLVVDGFWSRGTNACDFSLILALEYWLDTIHG